MFSFNLKINIKKYLFFCSWDNLFSVNVSDTYRYFAATTYEL